MERLKRVGQLRPVKTTDPKAERLGIGFEKLDRNMFDPHKAYDWVGALGVKWARIQSGWARTEKQKGVYDFEWLDDVVENLTSRGLEPWMCLCYGNALYTPEAAEYFGAVGFPPVRNEEEKEAWANYVRAVVERYLGKIRYYEVWNEPEGGGSWKYDESGRDYGKFVSETAKIVKSVSSDLKVIGGSVYRYELSYINDALSEMYKDIDAVSYHEYTTDEREVAEKSAAFLSLAKSYIPDAEIIQGESGSQSHSFGAGALCNCGWTPRKQAKQLLRHTVADLITDVKFTSYFACVDMVEALGTRNQDGFSSKNNGYFGVLEAELDNTGFSKGEYRPKPSYYAFQHTASMLGDAEPCTLPILFSKYRNINSGEISPWVRGFDLERHDIISSGFQSKGGMKAFVYWNPSELLTTEYEGTVSMQIAMLPKELHLVDFMDGAVYTLPDDMVEDMGSGCYFIHHLPIKDYPMALVFGECDKWELDD